MEVEEENDEEELGGGGKAPNRSRRTKKRSQRGSGTSTAEALMRCPYGAASKVFLHIMMILGKKKRWVFAEVERVVLSLISFFRPAVTIDRIGIGG